MKKLLVLLTALSFSVGAHAQINPGGGGAGVSGTFTAGDVICGSAATVIKDCGLSIGAIRNLTSGKTLVIYGDSFAANAGSSAAAYPCGSFCGSAVEGNYFTWAQVYSGYRVSRAVYGTPAGTPLTNCGVSGYTSAQILANISCPLAVKPDIVIMESGTNDAAGNITCATTTANNRSIYQQLNAAGIIVIKVSVIPRSSPNTYTTAQANLAQCYNEYDRRYAEEVGASGFYFVDLDPIVIDPTQSTWTIKSGYLVDGIHPASTGGSPMGYAIAQVINQVVPQWRQPIYTDGDTYDATNNPVGNLLSNGAFTGTGGSTSGTGCSGTVPTSVSVTCQAGATVVSSVVTLADGRSALKLVISGSITASSSFDVVRQTIATPANINLGDTLEAQAWVIMSPQSSVSLNFRLTTTESASTYFNDSWGINYTDPWPVAGFAAGQSALAITSRRVTTAVPSAAYLDMDIVYANGSITPSATIILTSETIKKVLP